MQIWCKSSADSVFKHDRIYREDTNTLCLHAAKNGHDFGQILLRDTVDFTLDRVEIKDIRGLKEKDITVLLQEYLTFNDGVPYPDRPVPFHSCAVSASATQSLMVCIKLPKTAKAGYAGFTVLVHTSAGDFEAFITVRIYDVTVPEPKDGVLSHEYFLNTNLSEFMGKSFEAYSDNWWTAMANIAKALCDMRINVLPVNVVSLLAHDSRRVDSLHWIFDFTTVDRWIEMFFAKGSFSRIVLSATTDSLTGANMSSFDEHGNAIKLPVRSDEYDAFAHQLFRAVYSHFEQKGWLSMLITHLEDEPHETENWLWLRGIIAECMPGVPCGEPIDEFDSAVGLKDGCDIFVPRLNVFEQGKDYFERRQKERKEVWTYTCCYPEDAWYLNRFIDQPMRYSRMLKWACFAQGITGFLHWGFNYWFDGFYGMNSDARFKGDGFVTYPDKKHKGVILSNRAWSILQGVEEYELLAKLSKKNPEAAVALARRIAHSFETFYDDADLLIQTRIELLNQCELL